MPIVTIKGEIEFMTWTAIMAWYDVHVDTLALPDFDQFLIECVVRGFEEVSKNVQV